MHSDMPSDMRPPEEGPGKLSRIGFGLSIVVACLVFVGLAPCLGWINWFALLVGGIGNILCWVGVFTEGQRSIPSRNRAIVGLVVSFIATFIGAIRLAVGGGLI